MKIPYDGEWINNWLSARSRIAPDLLAIVDESGGVERRFTVRDLENRASRAGSFLRDSGISKGDVVCAVSWPRVEVIDLLFACSKLGAVFFPLNTRLAPPEIEELVQQVMPKVFFYEEEFTEKVIDVDTPILVHSGSRNTSRSLAYKEQMDRAALLQDVAKVELEDPLMILQTGGTTGKPKIAKVNYRMILWNAVNTVRDLIIPYDTTITAIPLHHIGGFTYTIPLLFWGGTNILMPRWDVDLFLDLVQKERPTFLFLVPAQLKTMIDSPKFRGTDFSSVRFLTAGGAALTPEMIRAVFEKGITQKQGYGMTEMGPGIFALDPFDGYRYMGSIGKPNILVEAKVVRSDGSQADADESGELLLRGPSVFGGYLNNDEETLGTFDEGWLKTGDIARRTSDGYFYVVGRTKNVIRSGSESIFPEEVERILQSHPAVSEAIVIGIPDPKWGEVPKALVVLRGGLNASAGDLVSYCDGKIAKYKIPRHFEFVTEIPKDPMGKTSRVRLSQLFGEEK